MLHKLKNNPILSISIIILLMLGLNLDVIPVSIMEARNFITAREMITDGNWFLTTMNGEPRYQKPPLPSWICAFFGLAFGLKSLFALRLPAIIFIAITANYTFLISKEITKNVSQSFNNALILLTSFYVIAITFEAPSDIFTHGFMVIGIYHLLRLFRTKSSFLKRSLFAGFFIGCSILSKGPVSFYVLLLPFLLAYGCSYHYRFSKKMVFAFLGSIILALLVGGSWYLYVRLEDAETFTRIAESETGNWSSYNIRPFYYYWSFFVQSGIWTIPAFVGLLYPYMKPRVSDLKAYKFSLFWTLFAVVLLSIIPEKKSRYLMPVLIPLAVNTGFYIQYVLKTFKILKNKKELIPIYFHFGLIAIIALAVPLLLYFILAENLSEVIWSYLILSAVSLLIGVLLIFQLKRKNAQKAFYLNVLFFVSLLVFGLPLLNGFKGENYRPISALSETEAFKNLDVYSLDYIAPEMIWNYGDKIPQLRTEKGIQFPKKEKFGLLTQDLNTEDWDTIKQNYSVEKLRTYDLNIPTENSPGYNNRLQTDFFLLTKKN